MATILKSLIKTTAPQQMCCM